MEWWYVNSHLRAADGRAFSMFAAFFRVDVSQADAAERTFTHFLTWALVDETTRRYFPNTALDHRSPSIALDDIAKGKGPADERLSRALTEVLNRQQLPLPDRLLQADARVSLETLDLDYDGNRFVKRPDGTYQVDLASPDASITCRLGFTLDKPVVRHGADGVVRGVDGEDMFYYFSPRCRVEGAVGVDGQVFDVLGDGWYDHEFGERAGETPSDTKVAWNWVAAQLDNGYEVSAYDLIDKADPSISHGRWAIVVDPSGERRSYTDFALETLDAWTSTQTFNEYPTRYLLSVPEAGLSLDIAAAFPHQEMITLISAPGFWEGLTTITGTFHGAVVRGRGFIERSGLSSVDTTDEFFASVGRETRRAIDTLLPERPSPAQALALIGGPGREHYLDGISLDQYSRTVLQPIREIILRGGKAWRSYGILSCMDLVGGNSQPFAAWLALPELLHVGSLIIDDVQDDSAVRRGGPACHKIYGVPLAINAGCASYFLAQIPVGQSALGPEMRMRIYEAYFEAVRAAHAGQAFDIDGLGSLMAGVVDSGDGVMLERRVLGVHRLKSAAPAGALARMAAMIGGGTTEQAEGLGRLFESFGLAFQIIDDVLNLRGFDENRKNRGEDITAGKITAPVAKAMGRLPLHDRQRLWSIVASQPNDRAAIGEAIRIIDGCGALDACEAEARELVESAWAVIDPLIQDSQYKVRLRAFGWFVLDRHY
jgi:geranylgeranyl pyrophosphate synthase/predicted secreted hydrolase